MIEEQCVQTSVTQGLIHIDVYLTWRLLCVPHLEVFDCTSPGGFIILYCTSHGGLLLLYCTSPGGIYSLEISPRHEVWGPANNVSPGAPPLGC